MIKRMYARVMFDREIVKDYHSIMPGGRDGYEMRFGDDPVRFDFCDFYGYVDKTDSRILDIEAENLDIETCPEGEKLTAGDVRRLKDIIEFSVDTGDDDDPELHEQRLLKLTFEFEDGTVVDCTDMKAVRTFIFDEVFVNECYEAYKLDWMISHGYSLRDIMEIMTELAGQAVEDDVMTNPTNGEEVISLANSIADDFLDTGFGNGSLYICKDEFLGAEFRDEDYMVGLLSRRMDSEAMISKWRNYTNTPAKPEPLKAVMLNISTANITKETADFLDQSVTEKMSGIVVYPKIGLPLEVIKDATPEEIDRESYGWFVLIPQDERSDDLHELKGLPSDLFKCVKYADEHGYAWINFDPVYNSISELSEYDW